MKLLEALVLGHDCAMDTVEDAMVNVSMHVTNLFAYDDISDEINELNKDLETYDFDNNMPVIDAIRAIDPEYHECCKCKKLLKPGTPAFMSGAEGVDGEPETWYTCASCQGKCPVCGAELADGFYENIPAKVCTKCEFADYE